MKTHHYHNGLWLLCLCLLPGLSVAMPTCINKKLEIAIDIGHSPAHPGAISARGITEYNYNQTIAYLLQQRLLHLGFSNAFIISERNAEMPLHARASLANAKRAALLISIHHDSVQPHYLSTWEYEGQTYRFSDRYQGYSLFISEKNPEYNRSLEFAHLLGEELRSLDFIPTLHHAEPIAGENRPLIDENKGIHRFDDLIMLKDTKMPALLIECGVIVNRQEEELLASKLYQQNLVTALEHAIVRFAEVKPAVTP